MAYAEATGAPTAMGHCHCRSCRWWSAGPVNAFTLWKPANVKSDNSQRQFCRTCGEHHPRWTLVDVCAGILPELPFEPQLHVHYGESVLPVRDGLPKLRDLPAEMGGSGASLPE
jgi:hypothetical protein